MENSAMVGIDVCLCIVVSGIKAVTVFDRFPDNRCQIVSYDVSSIIATTKNRRKLWEYCTRLRHIIDVDILMFNVWIS